MSYNIPTAMIADARVWQGKDHSRHVPSYTLPLKHLILVTAETEYHAIMDHCFDLTGISYSSFTENTI